MIVSHNWLQKYFEDKLPSPEDVARTLIFHAFEVEAVEPEGDDFMFDVKILPDRAHDCLSHRGIARELATHLNVKSKVKSQKSKVQIKSENLKDELHIDIQEPLLCRRYAGRIIRGVGIGQFPEELRKHLLVIGQKSINNIVDAANYVMFDLGQPLHAFDADKVVGKITVRKAHAGEHITTLDGKDVVLDTETLVIADDEGPLAIAGIKGGRRAEITEKTTSIILEAANFDPVNIRKTSRRLGIQTDSSKRFENERSPEGVLEALDAAVELIQKTAGNDRTIAGDVVDVYPRKPNPYLVGISAQEANSVLGTNLSLEEIAPLLARASFEYSVVENPAEDVCATAPHLIGVPYVFGASITYDAPRAFDCSAFTAYLFARAGIRIPRMAVDQFVFGEPVSEGKLAPGDLVFSNTGEGKIHYESIEWLKGTKVPSGVDHCGIYLGHGNVIHATRITGKVVMEKLTESRQFKNIVGYRRITASAPRLLVTIPPDRIDIRLKEDLTEEIGRIYGYERVQAKKLSLSRENTSVHKGFFLANKIRNALVKEGFSEIYTSSFASEGDIALANPIAEDRGMLRRNLSHAMHESIRLNSRNLPLLGSDVVRVFEIGTVVTGGEGEYIALAVGMGRKDAQEELEDLLGKLFLGEGIEYSESEGGGVVEMNFTKAVEKFPGGDSYGEELAVPLPTAVFRPLSPYPFVLRDIAVFVPPAVPETEIIQILQKEGDPLLACPPKHFDRFEKKNKETGEVEKVSYAFRLVFQSNKKTLSDSEVNEAMEKVIAALNGREGWQVR